MPFKYITCLLLLANFEKIPAKNISNFELPKAAKNIEIVFKTPSVQNEQTLKWINESIPQIPDFILDLIPPQKITLYANLPPNAGHCHIYIKKKVGPDEKYFFSCLKLQAGGHKTALEKKTKRAIVDWLVYMADQKAKWSLDFAWLSINRWKVPFENITVWNYETQNLSPAGFVEPQGRKSPSRDFSTFVSHYLIPEEHYREIAPDLSLRCRLIAQSDYLEDLIQKRQPDFVPEIRLKTKRCPAFEKWAAVSEIDYAELIFSHPSAVFVGSLFGHIFLRLVPFEKNGVRPDNDTRAFGFVAMTHQPIETDPLSAVKGIFGLYNAMLSERPFRYVYLQYALTENRDMDSWKINLDRKKIRKLMARFWTIQHTALFRYRFFTENCASFLIDTINGLLPPGERIVYPHDMANMPSAILEGFLLAKNKQGVNLVTPLNEKYKSLKSEMMDSDKKRKSLARKLRLNYKKDRTLSKTLDDAELPDEAKRITAYRTLLKWGEEQKDTKGLWTDLYRYFSLSISIENFLLSLDVLKEEKQLNRNRLRHISGKVIQMRREIILTLSQSCRQKKNNLPACRLKNKQIKKYINASALPSFDKRMKAYLAIKNADLSFLDEDKRLAFAGALKAYMVMSAYVHFDLSYLVGNFEYNRYLFEAGDKKLSDQPYLPQDYSISYSHSKRQVSKSMKLLLDYKYRIKSIRHENLDLTPLNANQLSPNNSLNKSLNRSLFFPHTGVDMFYFGYYYDQKSSAAESGVFLENALVDEFLGENRQAGFPYYSGMSVLKSRLKVGLYPNKPLISSFYLLLLNYRLLEPHSVVEKAVIANAGWGFSLDGGTGYEDGNQESFGRLKAGPMLQLFHTLQYTYLLYTGFDLSLKNIFYSSRTKNNYNIYSLPVYVELKTPFLFKNPMSYLRNRITLEPFYNALTASLTYNFTWDLVCSIVLDPGIPSVEQRSPSKGVRFFTQFQLQKTKITDNFFSTGSWGYSIQMGIRLN